MFRVHALTMTSVGIMSGNGNGHLRSNPFFASNYNGGLTSPLAVVTVRKGRRYRPRIVSLPCDPSYDFPIDGHSLTVIEADGESTFPKTVDRLTISVGQRDLVIVRFLL